MEGKRTRKEGMGLILAMLVVFSFVGAGSNTSARFPLTQKGLVAYWSFDGGSGDTVHDSSGYSNHSKIEDATWVRGKFGNALNFDGEGDGIFVNCDDSLDLTDAVTIEAWVCPRVSLDYMAIVVNGIGGFDPQQLRSQGLILGSQHTTLDS